MQLPDVSFRKDPELHLHPFAATSNTDPAIESQLTQVIGSREASMPDPAGHALTHCLLAVSYTEFSEYPARRR